MWYANELDVLRARALASMPSKRKLQPQPVEEKPEVEKEEGELCSSDDKEEGEICSSDDDEVLLSSLPFICPTKIFCYNLIFFYLLTSRLALIG